MASNTTGTSYPTGGTTTGGSTTTGGTTVGGSYTGGGSWGGGSWGGGSCRDAGITGSCGLHTASPSTPNRVTPNISFRRYMIMDVNHQVKTKASGLKSFKVFAFGGDGQQFDGYLPNPMMRVKQGDIVHTNLSVWLPHTIHHHGIEPDAYNDGVGHYSFDVLGSYTYQWKASHAGTYFYHCHVNTVLHAEMGMYGPLIIDPPSGRGTAFEGGPRYDVEAIWAVDDIDTSWHCLPWDAAICGGDSGLNDFNPDIFIINGKGDADTETHASVAVTARVGQKILIRYIHAGYIPQRVTFNGVSSGLGPVTVIAEDGRPLITAEILSNSGGMSTTTMTPAERKEFYVIPTAAGKYLVKIEFLHWIRGTVVGIIQTYINVS